MQDGPLAPPPSINRAVPFRSPVNLELMAFPCFGPTAVGNNSFPQFFTSLLKLVAREYNTSTKLTLHGDGDKYFHRLGYAGLNRSVGRCSMAALVGNLTSVGTPFNWNLHFARQPEPDLEFTEEELDQTTSMRTPSPLPPRKRSSGGSPILWILLVALVGGIAYISIMDTEMLTELLAPYMGESTPPPVATKPKPFAPVPVPPQAPTPQAPPSPSGDASAPLSPPTSPTAAVVNPTTPAVGQPIQTPAGPATTITPPLDPMFSEGQKVTVTADDMAPGGSIPLFADSASSKPGPVVRPGVSLTIMDGDLQPGGWMYLVRTEEGIKGWVTEKRLRLKF